MKARAEGEKCVVCHAYLFDDDDVVYCPVCGAPHHRECYKQLGHCGLEQYHGTENQYDRVKEREKMKNAAADNSQNEKQEIICPNCLRRLEEDTPICPYCGRPRNNVGGFVMFDALGGVDKNTDIGGGVTAQTAAEFVGVNPQRYVPRFRSLSDGKKVSWNWLAFFFPHGWFLMRKMYAIGAIVVTLMVAAQILAFPMLEVLSAAAVDNMNDQMAYVMQNMATMERVPVVLAALSGFLNIAIRIVSALFGDYFYKKHIISRAGQMGSSDLERTDYIRKYGGINIVMFLAGILAVTYIPSIIAMFFIS